MNAAAEPSPGTTPLIPLAPLAPMRRQRASDRVYDELVEAIRSMRLTPGTLVSENELTLALRVSRTPIREALARLADVGLVTVAPQVGTRVSPISLREVLEAQWVREQLELAAWESACALPEVDVAAFDELLAAQDAARQAGAVDDFFAADESFHEAVFTLSGHGGAMTMLRPMKVQLDRVRRLMVHDTASLDALYNDHQALARAVAQRDPAAARRVGTQHVRLVLDYIPDLRARHSDWVTD